MTKKKSQAKPDYRIYVTLTGNSLAGEEVKRQGERIYVADPVFVSVKADGTGYDTKPVQFVPAGEAFRLYAYGLLGDTPMPPGMIPWYKAYREKRKAEQKNAPEFTQ